MVEFETIVEEIESEIVQAKIWIKNYKESYSIHGGQKWLDAISDLEKKKKALEECLDILSEVTSA